MSRKCRVCRQPFEPSPIKAVVCSYECALILAVSKRVKAEKVAQVKERKADQVKREKLKSRSQWAKEAQAAFNGWIRARDAGNACISCGRHHPGQNHAGHYLSVGARPELRYEPLNAWLQCAPCNTYLSGNAVLYRKALLDKIGPEKLAWLEGPHEPRKYTIEELRSIKKDYSDRLREIKEKKE